jgi:coenzyme F420-reducing hydrogenase alpha subunit
MSKHTEGKWETEVHTIEDYGDLGYCIYAILGGEEQYQIATIIGDVGEIDAEANAKLIRAAPEMLAMLKDLRPELKARIEGLQKTWPAPEVLLVLHRNESYLRKIDTLITEIESE